MSLGALQSRLTHQCFIKMVIFAKLDLKIKVKITFRCFLVIVVGCFNYAPFSKTEIYF